MKTPHTAKLAPVQGNVAGSALGYILPGMISLSKPVRSAAAADNANGAVGRSANWSSYDDAGQKLLVAFGVVSLILGVVVAVSE